MTRPTSSETFGNSLASTPAGYLGRILPDGGGIAGF